MRQLARQKKIAFVSAIGAIVLVVGAGLFIGGRGASSGVRAAGIASPTPTSSIAPLVQMIHIHGGGTFDATNSQLQVLAQDTFVAGNGALEFQGHVKFTAVSSLTAPTDTLGCRAYLDTTTAFIATDQVDYDANKVGTERSLSGTVPLTKGTHTVYLSCLTSGQSTTTIMADFDMVVVTGATSVSVTGQG